MNAHNFYPMNNQTKIKITGTPSGFITCGLPQVGAAVSNSDTPRTDNSIVETDWLGTRVELVNADFARQLERENAALREALQNCAISASGQNWQQIAWIVEGALYDPRKEAQP